MPAPYSHIPLEKRHGRRTDRQSVRLEFPCPMADDTWLRKMPQARNMDPFESKDAQHPQQLRPADITDKAELQWLPDSALATAERTWCDVHVKRAD